MDNLKIRVTYEQDDNVYITGVSNDDVRYMCGFYGIPYKENWVREETCDISDSFYVLIKVDGN